MYCPIAELESYDLCMEYENLVTKIMKIRCHSKKQAKEKEKWDAGQLQALSFCVQKLWVILEQRMVQESTNHNQVLHCEWVFEDFYPDMPISWHWNRTSRMQSKIDIHYDP